MSPLSLRALSRGARRRTVVAPLLIAAPLALAALPAAAQAGQVVLRDQGCANEWTVPTGVAEVTITLQGQPGADGRWAGTGGSGAYLNGTLAVSPGDVLHACVNVGGGAGGTAESGATAGGAGGGFTSIGTVADPADALALAGGGGGAGGYYGIGASGNGGNAGTTAPNANGSNGMQTTDWLDANGGVGGNADGTGGAGGLNRYSATFSGQSGESRRGGAGGNGLYGGPGGGGGGAGVAGGGGGAAAQGFRGTGGSATSAGAGGGGGTSSCTLAGCRFATSHAAAGVTIDFADPPTPTTTTVAFTERAIWNKQGTLRAVVSPAPAGGTVTFEVDGRPQSCGPVTVDTTTGVAECETTFPSTRGSHTATATYSGYNGLPAAFDRSDDEDEFIVYAGVPAVTPNPTAAFGEVELGKSTTRPLTITNVGDADLTFDDDESIYVAEYGPRARPPRSREFTVVDDGCAGRVVAPNASCTVTVKFTPSALGEFRADIEVYSDSYEGADPVVLTGTGIEARPEPQPEPQPQPRQPETPSTPTTPAAPQTPVTPAAPTPSKPAELTRTPPAIGASAPSSVARGAPVTQAGAVRLPLICPPGQACSVSGTLTLAVTGGQARAAAKATTRVLVRFSGVKLAAGKTKTLSLKLPASFVKAQQAKGVRKLRTTLTVNTVLGNGTRITRRQAVTLIIPRARAAQRAAPRQIERPSFTG